MKKYRSLLCSIYEELKANDCVSAADMADIALSRLGIPSDGDAAELCIYALSRFAERVLGSESRGRNGSQFEMFDLQERYPTKDDVGKPTYKRLEIMSNDEIIFVEGRLRVEGNAKIAHADSLFKYRVWRGWEDGDE